MANKKRVGIIFGSRSTEHEISIITGLQVFNNIDREKFDPAVIYVSKSGEWYANNPLLEKIETYRDLNSISKKLARTFLPPDTSFNGLVQDPRKYSFLKKFQALKLDIVFPCFHGTYGEDGVAMGLFEMAAMPYVGCGVLASAVSMDKIMTRSILKQNNIPVTKAYDFLKEDWENKKSVIVSNIEKKMKYPVFVKPANGGSSIGVRKANKNKELIDAVDVAKFYDRRILVEEGVVNPKEVNISVLGYKTARFSEIEMPIANDTVLSYEDKYKSGQGKSSGMAGLKRLIPAPVKPATKKIIENLAVKTFGALDCSGVVRIDFLLSQDEKRIFLNEVNPLPGSISFYLWEPKGLKISALITKLIELGFERYEDRNKNITTFSTNVLEGFSGTKS